MGDLKRNNRSAPPIIFMFWYRGTRDDLLSASALTVRSHPFHIGKGLG